MPNGRRQQHRVCQNRRALGMELVWASHFSLCKVRIGSTFIPAAFFSNTDVEMASLVSDVVRLYLSLFNEEYIKDDESLYAK